MTQDRNEVGSGPDANEPKTIEIPGRSMAGASYGATEREQTADVRAKDIPRTEGIARGENAHDDDTGTR